MMEIIRNDLYLIKLSDIFAVLKVGCLFIDCILNFLQ